MNQDAGIVMNSSMKRKTRKYLEKGFFLATFNYAKRLFLKMSNAYKMRELREFLGYKIVKNAFFDDKKKISVII
jgi:hypothetical protein